MNSSRTESMSSGGSFIGGRGRRPEDLGPSSGEWIGAPSRTTSGGPRGSVRCAWKPPRGTPRARPPPRGDPADGGGGRPGGVGSAPTPWRRPADRSSRGGPEQAREALRTHRRAEREERPPEPLPDGLAAPPLALGDLVDRLPAEDDPVEDVPVRWGEAPQTSRDHLPALSAPERRVGTRLPTREEIPGAHLDPREVLADLPLERGRPGELPARLEMAPHDVDQAVLDEGPEPAPEGPDVREVRPRDLAADVDEDVLPDVLGGHDGPEDRAHLPLDAGPDLGLAGDDELLVLGAVPAGDGEEGGEARGAVRACRHLDSPGTRDQPLRRPLRDPPLRGLPASRSDPFRRAPAF